MMWQFFQRTGKPAWRAAGRTLQPAARASPARPQRARPGLHLPQHLSALVRADAATTTCAQVLIQAGRTLAMRFQEQGQYLCSFVGPESLFIDIMMNVPIIFYAARETGDADLQRIAEAHCRTTRDTLVRPDGSTAHEGIFDLETRPVSCGSRRIRGLRADSGWARGLAWSLYGYSQVYALTGNEEFLDVAERNADFWLTHLPKDHVPYWDFAADLQRAAALGPAKGLLGRGDRRQRAVGSGAADHGARPRRRLSANGAGHARRAGRARVPGRSTRPAGRASSSTASITPPRTWASTNR